MPVVVMIAVAVAATPLPAPTPSSLQERAKLAAWFPPSLSLPTEPCLEGDRPTSQPSRSGASLYGHMLKVAGERSLYAAASAKPGRRPDALRFLWLRSFHAPIVVRVEWARPGRATLHAARLGVKDGHAVGVVEDRLTRALTVGEERSLAALRADSDAIYEPVIARCGPPPVDGADWVVESVDAKGYHVAVGPSPYKGGLRRMGLSLLRLTGWPLDPVY